MWRQHTRRAAEPRAKLSRGGLRWALAFATWLAERDPPGRNGLEVVAMDGFTRQTLAFISMSRSAPLARASQRSGCDRLRRDQPGCRT